MGMDHQQPTTGSRKRAAAVVIVAGVFACALAFAGAGGREPAETDRPPAVKVAAVQCSSDLGAVEANRKKLTALVEEAAAAGAKIIVLPETAITGYLSQDLQTNWRVPGKPMDPAFKRSINPLDHAEPVPGPSTEHFAALAKRLGVYVTVPLLERVDKPTGGLPLLFNTVCLASPKGEIVAHYRKLTPWPHPEQSWATAGDRGVQVYDTEYGRVGLAICFDIHTILPKYQPHDIWALLYPIAWVDESHPAEWFWHKLPKQIATNGNHYVIGANWSVDTPQPWYGYGFSAVIAPDGKVVASANSLYGSEIVYADVPRRR